MFQTKFGKPTTWNPAPRARTGIDPVRDSPPPSLIGDFARAAYFGALHISDLMAVIDNADQDLVVLTDMYIHSLHEVPYTLADAAQVTSLDFESIVLVAGRLARLNMIRRQGKLNDGIPYNSYDRIELAPMHKAELTGFFARAYERGPAVLEEWTQRR